MNSNLKWLCLVAVVLSFAFSEKVRAADRDVYKADVCVYGGTASGVAAALAAARRGQDVIIVEPFRHLGGMHGGGIRIQQDCLYLDDIGGIARELHDADQALAGNGSTNQWGARQLIRRKVEEAGIRYFTEYRLDDRSDVVKDGSTIEMIHLNHAPVLEEGVPAPKPAERHAFSIKADVFIDASYEGDLMAFAGCDYVLGRESKAEFGESLAGQGNLRHYDVDPYVVPGDPKSGLLPMISSEPYEPGEASRYQMAYNFRLPGLSERWRQGAEVIPFKPLGKKIDRKRFEVVLRGLDSPDRNRAIGFPSWNYSRHSMVSSSPMGLQADYPDSTWAVRSDIWRTWIDHVKTMNTLCRSADAPALIVGEYPDNDDFPDQLYVRLGRRMTGEYVVTQNDLMHQKVVTDPIGLGYYAVDIYPPRLIADQGKVATEGEKFIRVSPGPYQISYRALVPQEEQCTNLIVPVCMSASHVAMASIRMESTYVVMGEAAGIAASHAVDSGKAVQNIQYSALRRNMDKANVITEWDGIGYGPASRRHWPYDAIHWMSHPEDYTRIEPRLDPSWADYDPKKPQHAVQVEAYASVEQWNAEKPGYEWLFPFIDQNSDGKISLEEHAAFQTYKKENKTWQRDLKATLQKQ